MEKISRAQFLRGDFKNQHNPIRPPWALEESLFVQQCSNCLNCISACNEAILITGRGKLPLIDFNLGECTFCFACVEQCNDGALSGLPDTTPWTLKASINDSCLTFKDIHCMSCREQCETEAIQFIHEVAKTPQPVVDVDLCTGCGACFKPCPSESIQLNYYHSMEPAEGSHLKETAL